MHKEENAWTFIPLDNPTKQIFYSVNDYFHLNDLIVVGIESEEDIFNQASLEKIQRLTNQFKTITIITEKQEEELNTFINNTSGEIQLLLKEIQKDGISRDDIHEIANLEKFIKSQDQPFSKLIAWIEELRISLFPLEEVNSFFTVEHIKGTEYGLTVDPLIENVPETRENLAQVRDEAISNDLFDKIYISSDRKSTMITLELAFSENERMKTAPLYYKLKQVIDSEKGPEKIYLGGTPLLWVLERAYSENDLERLIPIVLVVIITLLFVFFRNLQGIYLPMAIVLVSVIWAMGLTSILNIKFTILGSVVPVVLIAIGTADAIHILTHYYGELRRGVDKESALKNTMDRMAKPVVMTSLTTMVGFSSLAISDIADIRNFGLFTSFGIFSAMIFSLTVMPAALTLLKSPIQEKNILKNYTVHQNIFNRFGTALQRSKWISLSVIIFLICATGYGTIRVNIEYAPAGLFKSSADIRQAHDFINKYFAGVTWINLVLESKDENNFVEPELLNKLGDLQAKIEGHNEVGKIISIVDFIERMNYVMHDEKESYKRVPHPVEKEVESDWIEKDGREIEEEQEVEVKGHDQIAQYLLLYEGAGGKDLEKVVDTQYEQANMRILLRTDKSTANKEIISAIGRYCKEVLPETIYVTFSGISTLLILVADMVVKGQILSIMISFVIVLFMMACMVRSPLGMLGFLPIGFTILCNFAIMTIFKVPLDIGTSIVSSIAIGIGVDYCIHFLVWKSDEMKKGFSSGEAAKLAITGTGRAISINALVVAAGFLVLISSNFVPLMHFGWMVCVTMLICAVSTLTIIPTVLLLFSGRRVKC
ncbi:exporter of the RND superfamily [Candidatus Scalindua japonica]|uniref:Exporter of the RND superfamily n=2 Tax=Candidatus Scalindua japonica TaxID=1284222 RepID=A0A286TZI2_9BACT|nr:exporter of the RND superfamily [Candidatus Scalindua japonica]